MRKRFYSMLLAFVMLLGLCVLSPLSAAADAGTATAYDVYVSGNYMVGETLTAHYTYYDPMGLPEVTENVQYQWYRRSRTGTITEIEGATGSTYTITADDPGSKAADMNYIFVKVTTANENGSGTGVNSGLLIGSAWDMKSKTPYVFNAYIEPQNPTGSMKVGDTLVAHFAYQNNTKVSDEQKETYPNNIYVPEGGSTYQWQTKDSITGTATVVQEASTSNTYTLTSDDFGKVIECVITPKSDDGVAGSSYTAVNHYNNLFYGKEAIVTNISDYYNPNIPSIEVIRDKGGFGLYSQSRAAEYYLYVDAGREEAFDGIYLNYEGDGITSVQVFYSSDNESWTPVSGEPQPEGYEFKLDSPALARYFKLSIVNASGRVYLSAFYPYISGVPSTATAYDVYVSGNYLVGETLTAHYSYYDAKGLPEVTENVQYQWYKRDRDGLLTAIEGATSSTYTIQSGDEGTKWGAENYIFVEVTPANANGLGKSARSGILLGTPFDRTEGPSVFHAHIVPQNPEGSMEVGDTLAAHFAYQNDTKVAEGDSTYQWQTKDSLSGEATVVQEASTNNTYTLKSEDFGKVIECVITPIDANGTVGTAYTALNHYGNLFYGQNTAITDITTRYNTGGELALEMIRDVGGFQLFSAKNTGTYDIVVDTGRMQSFDGVFLSYEATTSSIAVSYSSDNVTWNDLEGTIVQAGYEFRLENPITARYFKLSMVTSSGRIAIYAFYPFVTSKDSLKLISEDGTVASELEGGATYTLQYRLDEGLGSVCYDYIAVYELLYCGEELKSTSLFLCKKGEHEDYGKLSVTLPEQLSVTVDEATGYSKKYVVKAFSLSENLTPNKEARMWE